MKKIVFLLISLLCYSSYNYATIINPPSSIGEMADNATLVAYGTIISNAKGNPYLNNFKILQTIKGAAVAGSSIWIKEYSGRVGDEVFKISGDLDFEIGKSYLLFLSPTSGGFYQSILLAYSAYEEGINDGIAQFAQTKNVLQLEFGSDANNQLSGVYEKTKLINQLNSYLYFAQPWSAELAGYSAVPITASPKLSSSSSLGPCPNTPPAHCTTLFGNPASLNTTCNANSPAKFASNVWTVKVAGAAASDPSNITAISNLQTAIGLLDAMPGITMTYEGLDASCTPVDCGSGAGFGVANAANVCNGSATNIYYVFFNDPCSQVADLSGCSGTLGVGGHFSSSVCHTDICNNNWKNASTPFFVMNNGSGCTGVDKYIAVLSHEMLHAMGLGHISGTCTALMNATVCNLPAPTVTNNYNITSLDNDCTDWMYKISSACVAPATSGVLAVVQSNCGSSCLPSGGSIAIGTKTCTSGIIEFSTDNIT